MEPRMTTIVRSYSLELEQASPSDPISCGLGAVAAREVIEDWSRERELQEWQLWLRFEDQQSDSTLKPLQEQCKRVTELWKEFGHLFPDLDQSSPSTALGIPSIDKLHAAVTGACGSWESKGETGVGKVQQRFFDFLGMMDDHSAMFSVLPNGDKYTCLITGVVSSIVKASVNHRKTAEGFSAALTTISDDLRMVRKHVKISDTPETRRLVVDLYVKVFEFLCYTMSWYKSTRKRFRKSWNKNFYDDQVESRVLAIQQLVKRFQAESDWVEKVRVRNIQEGMLELQSLGSICRSDDLETVNRKLDSIHDMLKQLGMTSGRHLGAVEQQFMHDQSSRRHHSLPMDSQVMEILDDEDEIERGSSDSDNRAVLTTRAEVRKYSEHLDEYVQDGRAEIARARRRTASSTLPEEVVVELQKWIKTASSKVMWVQGIASSSYGSDLSQAAYNISSMTMDAGIPCISYFCKPRYGSRSSGSQLSSREEACTSLLYSVIAQLVRLLPDQHEQTDDLSEARFALLDSSTDSFQAAIDTIDSLLAHTSPFLVLVIDGLQLAEQETTVPYFLKLVEILRDRGSKRVLKVLFTTDGNSIALSRATRITERVDASRMAQRRRRHLVLRPSQGEEDIDPDIPGETDGEK